MTFGNRFHIDCMMAAIIPGRIIAALFKTPRSAARLSDIVGCVDGPSRGRLQGWAFDRRNPLQRLTVAMEHPTGRRVVALADRYRADVHQSGIGDGYYGFSLPMTAPDVAGSVFALQGESAVALPRALRGPEPGSAVQTYEISSYTLHVDRLGPRHISGWAVDAAVPERRRILQLHCNARIAGRQRATLHRAEIVHSQCDGYHGFWFALPSGPVTSLSLEDLGFDKPFVVRP